MRKPDQSKKGRGIASTYRINIETVTIDLYVFGVVFRVLFRVVEESIRGNII